MNEKEKREFYIANCRCCLLAHAMKNCSSCQFQVGLEEQPSLAGSAIPEVMVRLESSMIGFIVFQSQPSLSTATAQA